jgi:site-specific DNA recombinase
MRTAIGYTRISKDEENSVSLDYQNAEIRRLAKKDGYALTGIETDNGISGKSITARPAIQRVLQAIDQRSVDAILIYKSDRLSRDGMDSLQIEKLAIRRGVALISVTEGDLTGDSVDDGFLRYIRAGLNERERKLVSLRTKAALARKKEKGERLGRPRYGWRVQGGALVEIPEEQRAIIRMRELQAAGYSVREISQALKEEGIANLGKSRVAEILKAA